MGEDQTHRGLQASASLVIMLRGHGVYLNMCIQHWGYLFSFTVNIYDFKIKRV